MLIYLLFCYTFLSDLWVHDVRLIRMLNDVIMHYTLIFALIYWLPLTTSPHVCIVTYMWVHPVCYLNRVWHLMLFMHLISYSRIRVCLVVYTLPCLRTIKSSGTQCGDCYLMPQRPTTLIRWKVLNFTTNEVSGVLSMLEVLPAIQNVVWYSKKW
jgi:hypothetical protein